jgi:hypothetical protein
MPSDPDDLVSIPNVRALADGLALVCQLSDGRRVSVPPLGIAPGSAVRKPGDYGTLVLRREYAERLALASPGRSN